jgi:hypothetical protein
MGLPLNKIAEAMRASAQMMDQRTSVVICRLEEVVIASVPFRALASCPTRSATKYTLFLLAKHCGRIIVCFLAFCASHG